jgi:hypothetical protein
MPVVDEKAIFFPTCVAIGVPFEIARRVERVVAQRLQVVQRVVAVTRALAGVDETRLPLRRRREQQLRLAEGAVPVVDVVAGHVVLREAVALRVAEGEADRGLAAKRAGGGRAHVDRAVIAERHHRGSRPPGQGRPRRADVNEAAQRVASEERALRTAHELQLADVEQLEAGRVGVQLRHAVDIGRNRGIGRARPDAAEARVAQLPRGEVGEIGVRRVDGRLANGGHAAVPQRIERDDADADRQALWIGRLLLGGDGHGRQRDLPGRLGGLGGGDGGQAEAEEDEGQSHAHHYAQW